MRINSPRVKLLSWDKSPGPAVLLARKFTDSFFLAPFGPVNSVRHNDSSENESL